RFFFSLAPLPLRFIGPALHETPDGFAERLHSFDARLHARLRARHTRVRTHFGAIDGTLRRLVALAARGPHRPCHRKSEKTHSTLRIPSIVHAWTWATRRRSWRDNRARSVGSRSSPSSSSLGSRGRSAWVSFWGP